MMGERRVMQAALFYGFSLERHVPSDHLLRKIDRFVDLSGLRAHLGPYYSDVGRPSIDPELMMRMLIVGYCFGIRSERRLCEEVHLNLAYRWFCRLGLDGDVPDHSTFSKNRHGRFRESDLLRKLFETVVARCMKEGIVGGEAFAVDASMIMADAHRRRGVAKVEDLDPTSNRAVAEYLSVLDDAAFGGATPVEPKLISPTDPAARYTAAANTPAVYAYSDNYLIDLKKAVIMDVEATTAIRQAEVDAAKTMLDRTTEKFDVTPGGLVADAGYGSAEMIEWLGGRARDRAACETDGQIRTHGRDLLAQRLRLRSGSQPLCLPRGQRAKEIPPRFLQATPGADEGRHADLLRQQARLRGLRAQAHMLPERTRTQDRALRS
jgi:transposase